MSHGVLRCPKVSQAGKVISGARREQLEYRARELVKMANHPVGAKLCHRGFSIAKIDRDHWHRGRAGGVDVGGGITHHHGPVEAAPGLFYCAPQYFGVGLVYAERVLATDRDKAGRQVQSIQQAPR